MNLTPLTQRRIAQFKKNRRGYYSLIVFMIIFLMTSCAEFIANDKPLVVYFNGHLYCPILTSYPETHWGGTFETETNYRDPVVRDLILDKGWYVFPPIPYSFDTVNYDLAVPAPAPPSSDNWLGTDDQGRDLLARLIYGTRISIWFGLILTLFAMLIGITVGGLQGYFGGKVDLYVQRFIEIWSGLPILYLLMILSRTNPTNAPTLITFPLPEHYEHHETIYSFSANNLLTQRLGRLWA